MDFLTSLLNSMPGAAAQGLIWGIMAIGVYITYKILDVADLTVDGSLATGGAVVVSQYLGAKDRPDADKSAGQLLLLSGLSGAVIGAVCFVLARPMIRLFYGSIDTDVLDAGVKYLQRLSGGGKQP